MPPEKQAKYAEMKGVNEELLQVRGGGDGGGGV